MSTGKKAVIVTLVIGFGTIHLVLAWGQIQPSAQSGKEAEKRDDESPARIKARAAAAERAYEGALEAVKRWQRWDNGHLVPLTNPKVAYHWSIQWCHAQRDLSNKKEERIADETAHLERMRSLEEIVGFLSKDVLYPFERDAAKYYRVEAEIWLEQDKKIAVPPALRVSRAESAKNAYDGFAEALKQMKWTRVGDYLEQVSKPEDVYCWSVRWFQAQRDLSDEKEKRVAAAAAHLERMQELKKRVENLVVDVLPRFERDAAEYYRLEAEMWLELEKKTPAPIQPVMSAEKSDRIPALRIPRAQSAKNAYEGAAEGLKQTKWTKDGILVQVSKPKDVYFWSVRWFQAQRDLSDEKEKRVAAAAAHLERMQELKKRVEKLVVDVLPRFERDAVEYYRLEAEMWLTQAKSK